MYVRCTPAPKGLLFCGHKTDSKSGRLSPIWTSDDHAKTYTLRASLPRGSPPPFDEFGPDECQFAELADGTVIYNARNNWPTTLTPEGRQGESALHRTLVQIYF